MKTSLNAVLRIGLLGLCLAVPSAWAQDANNPNAMGQSDMQDRMSQDPMHKHMHENMMGKHNMPAVVDSVDTTTGLVSVTSEQMQLKLHFPPASVSSLKAGDHITLYLAFSK